MRITRARASTYCVGFAGASVVVALGFGGGHGSDNPVSPTGGNPALIRSTDHDVARESLRETEVCDTRPAP